MKLGPPNSEINSMRSRAAARDTTPERAGVSEMSRVAGRAMLLFQICIFVLYFEFSGTTPKKVFFFSNLLKNRFYSKK